MRQFEKRKNETARQDTTGRPDPFTLLAYAATVRTWLKRGENWTGFNRDGSPDVIPQERFARGFEAMLNLGIAPAPVRRQIRNVPLTDEQYDEYAKTAGRMSKMRLDVFVRSPEFQQLPAHAQHDWVEAELKASRTAAEGILMMKYPEIPRLAAKAQNARHTAEPVAIH